MSYQNLKYLDGVASVIITTYNDSRFIKDCIKSLVENTSIPIEIIVCDNSTIPETRDNIRKYAEQSAEKAYDLKIIHSRNQTSIGHVNNYGMQVSRGQYLFYANDDIKMITENWCERMIDSANKHIDGGVFGIVGTSTYYKQTVSDKYQPDNYKGKVEVSATVAGILIHIPRNVIDKLGLWDENLSNYCWLDVDWSIRVRAAGLKPYFCKDVFALHLRRATAEMKAEQQKLWCDKYGVDKIKTESDLIRAVARAKEVYGYSSIA